MGVGGRKILSNDLLFIALPSEDVLKAIEDIIIQKD